MLNKEEMRKHQVSMKNGCVKKTKIRYTRYIATWLRTVLMHEDILKACNDITIIYGDDFKDWLKSEGATDQEVWEIKLLAIYGSRDLQESAEAWISKL